MRKVFFWVHLSTGVAAGLFIFIMAATGVVLSFERQILELIDRDVRSVPVPNDAPPRSINKLLDTVRRAAIGEPASMTLRNEPQSAIQFSIGRNKAVYVDPYSGAILGLSSARAHEFFFVIERLHRTLGAPLGSKSVGHWLMAVSNLLFGGLILLGIFLWLPRKWSWNAIGASIAFRTRLRGKAREWNWHNVLGIWCALPLLVIALSGVVMSFEWANALLFRMTGSTPAAPAPRVRVASPGPDANYDQLFAVAKTLQRDWRTISLNIPRNAAGPITAVVDTGAGGQPQKRTQYLLHRNTGAVISTTKFAAGSLGQRLRAFVRFGHTGEYFGWLGQLIAALASLAASVLVYTGLSLSVRRLAAALRRRRTAALQRSYAGQRIA